jgi:hypothetical protein
MKELCLQQTKHIRDHLYINGFLLSLLYLQTFIMSDLPAFSISFYKSFYIFNHINYTLIELVYFVALYLPYFNNFELPILPVHPSSPLIFYRIYVAQSLVFYVVFVNRFFTILTFILLTIVLSVYPFDIFKPYFECNINSVFITVLKLFILYYM